MKSVYLPIGDGGFRFHYLDLGFEVYPPKGIAKKVIFLKIRIAATKAETFAVIQEKLKGFKMPRGTVKFFNAKKGFGFIQPDDGSNDVFVHITAVERAGMRSLIEGQKISYEIVMERGKQAAGNLQSA